MSLSVSVLIYEMGRGQVGQIDLEGPFRLEKTLILGHTHTHSTVSPHPSPRESILGSVNNLGAQIKSQRDLQKSLHFPYNLLVFQEVSNWVSG